MKYEDIKKIVFSKEIYTRAENIIVVGMTDEKEKEAFRKGWRDAIRELCCEITEAEMQEQGKMIEPNVQYFFRHGEGDGEYVKEEDLTEDEAAAVKAWRERTERKKG